MNNPIVTIPKECLDVQEAKLFWAEVAGEKIAVEGSECVRIRMHPQRCRACRKLAEAMWREASPTPIVVRHAE